MNRSNTLPLTLAAGAALGLLASSGSAQRVVDNSCQAGAGSPTSEYGRSVSAGEGDPTAVLIGAPRARVQFVGASAGSVHMRTGQVIYGDDEDDRFGASVAAGLDLDADGIPDGVGGAPGDDDGGSNAGSIKALAGAAGSVLYTVHGDLPGDEFGTSLAALGDLDGDGIDEVLVGATQMDAVSPGPGYARVLSGADGTELRTHHGAAAGDRFGLGLTGLDDLDADGVEDYAVGAPDELGTGRVRIFSGASGALLRTHDGQLPGGLFGYSLGSGSDLDRDGLGDLVVGAPHGGLAPGSVEVFSGADGSTLLAVSGQFSTGWFGASVAGLGDFDGDGHGDLIVGAPSEDPLAIPPFTANSSAGQVSVFSGVDGTLLASLGGTDSARLGNSVAGGVDFDGDGLPDALIGAVMSNDGYGFASCVTAIGRPYDERVARGPGTNAAASSGTGGSPATPGYEAARYGHSVAGIGDLDGDGAGELLIGAPDATDPSGQRPGLARVVSGRTGGVLRDIYGSANGFRFGIRVANAGDVDADGFDDLLVGSLGYAEVFSGASGIRLHRFDLASAPPGFGYALAGQADLDGDGHDDLIVGGASPIIASGFSQSFFSGGGAVRVYSGRTGAELHALDDSGGAYGNAVAFIGDLSGDGVDDFLVSAPERESGLPFQTGEIEVRSGADGSLLQTLTAEGLRNGAALTRLGDVNADGVEDFAWSTWDPNHDMSYGKVYAISGLDFTELWMAEGAVDYNGPSFGFSLASAGDVNGDGSPDIAIGVPGTFDLHGPSIGSVEVRTGSGGGTLAVAKGYSGWDYFGYSVAGLGDLDGDGLAEVAIGVPTEPDASVFGINRVHILTTGSLRQHNHCALSANSSGQPATIAAEGLGQVALNDLTLSAAGSPAGAGGLFIMGLTPNQLPFGNGYRCVSGPFKRVSRLVNTGPTGTYVHPVDLASTPASAITPGSTWSFQFIFRDSGSVDASDAVRIEFLP